MDPSEYSRIAAAEDAHWWYRGTRALMRQLLDKELGSPKRVLDAGCGPGGNSAWLLPGHDVVGLDLSPEALRLAGQLHPGVELHEGDVTELPFDGESFDLVLVITVLHAVPDHALAAGEIARVLRPGGTVMLLEPAVPWLRREHDTVVGGLRRYRLGDLRGLVEDAGLLVRRATHAYSFLLPPALLLALRHRLGPSQGPVSSDLQRDRLGWLFGPLAALERRVLRRFDIPFGLSAVVVAQRPAGPDSAASGSAAQIVSTSQSSNSG